MRQDGKHSLQLEVISRGADSETVTPQVAVNPGGAQNAARYKTEQFSLLN